MACWSWRLSWVKSADDLRPHVEGHQRDVILGPQLLRKRPGGIAHVIDERSVAVGGKLAEHQRGDRRFNALEADTFCSTPSS